MENDQIKQVIDKLTGMVGESGGVKLIYGETRNFENRSIIPVAQVRYGFGGGGGRGKGDEADPAEGEGLGFGGGIEVKPVGYIDITPNRVDFRPVFDIQNVVMGVAALVSLVFVKSMFKGILCRRR